MYQYKHAAMAMVALVALLALGVLIWCRWRLPLTLYCRHKVSHSAKDNDGYLYDLFLIHGDSTSHWVWSVLLPTLEDTYGYRCFLPQRDMHAGDQVAESILSAIQRCRRVVVVVTPCLLDSAWATWSAYAGIHAVLTSSTRILALVFKAQRAIAPVLSAEKSTLLGILRVVKKVRVPEACGWHMTEDDPGECIQQQDFNSDKKEENKEFQLTLPEIRVDRAWTSDSPKSQKVSNMITGSNAASREDLDTPDQKDPKASGSTTTGPIIYTEQEQGMEDPGSPCSITPFILPSSCRRSPPKANKNTMCCQCMRVVCVGEPETQFWQRVRLGLGPPSFKHHLEYNANHIKA